VETDRSVSLNGIRPLDAAGEQRMCGFSEMERCRRKVPAGLNHLLSGPDSVPEGTQILALSTSREKHICCDYPGVDWRRTRRHSLFPEGDASEVTPSLVIGSRAPPEHRALGGLARAILRVIDRVSIGDRQVSFGGRHAAAVRHMETLVNLCRVFVGHPRNVIADHAPGCLIVTSLLVLPVLPSIPGLQ
jgi:hypothetical protein